MLFLPGTVICRNMYLQTHYYSCNVLYGTGMCKSITCSKKLLLVLFEQSGKLQTHVFKNRESTVQCIVGFVQERPKVVKMLYPVNS